MDMKIVENIRLHRNYCLLKLAFDGEIPEILPGQFVEVRVNDSPTTFLRRPISVHYVDFQRKELWLLIQLVGDGTRKMSECHRGDFMNLLLPLGNGFTIPSSSTYRKVKRLLLVGGGVGSAPMLYLGACLKKVGLEPTFLMGARSKGDVLQLDMFEQYGKVYITTEDGSLGEKGYVTDHSILRATHFDRIYTCGPKPMMMAVARYADAKKIDCEVSLENLMACGLGACLCCVEKDKEGHHVRVCTEGPVFNIKNLSWLS